MGAAVVQHQAYLPVLADELAVPLFEVEENEGDHWQKNPLGNCLSALGPSEINSL